MLGSNLLQRHRQPEWMDQPDLDPAAHRRALDGLRRINGASRSTEILWPPLKVLARREKLSSLRVLDIASGAGDLPIKLYLKAKSAGISLDIVGCDISLVAIEYAQAAAERAKAPVRFVQRDVFRDPMDERYDVVTSSLFLHHLDEEHALRLLTVMSTAAQRLMLVNDLRRCRRGYWLAQGACRVLSRSPVVHLDGPRSVEGAFSIEEARRLCAKIPLSGATVAPRWPFRFLLQWTPGNAV